MLEYPSINPVLLSLGPLQIRWYGLMYVIGFTAAYLLVMHQAKKFRWDRMFLHVDNLNLALILGVVLGGRLGYVIFYNPAYYWAHPLEIPAIWTGGMSFHGGFLGAFLAGFLYCRRTGLDFWKAADLYIVTVPVGLFLAGWAILLTANCTAGSPMSPGQWSFPKAALCPGTLRNSMKPCLRDSSSSWSSGQ